MTTTDPFACIPNSSDDEYAGTILETPQQRERRERQHAINGAGQDAAPAAAGTESPDA